MNNRSLLILTVGAGFALSVSGWAQETSSLLKPVNELPTLGDSSGSDAKAKKKDAPKAADKASGGKGPTEITCSKGVTFEEKTRVGVFSGNVKVVDPQFTLTSDKLTVVLKKEQSASGSGATPAGAKPKASPAPTPATPTAGAAAAASTGKAAAGSKGKDDPTAGPGGGLERAIAEGHVVVIQDKPAEDGGEPKHYVGKANKLDYDSNTGDVTLTGWPQIQQGINTQAATEEGTVMVLNRDGRLRTTGGCHTIIQDQSEK